MKLIIKPLTTDLWSSLEDLFGKKGANNGCWCMYWRIGGEYNKRPGELNRQEFKAIVEKGPPPGLIAFHENIPVGWCQLTLKSSLPRLEQDYKTGGGENDAVWCISCFYVRTGYRRKGITSALIKSAIQSAKKANAKVLEAYPRNSDSSYTGYPSSFLNAGFKVIGEGKYNRTIMRIDL
jgi:GNAT superfamily N-acetyltransferase